MKPIALGLLGAVVALAVLAAPAAARPNVVVVMTDDQDFRSMGAMRARRSVVRMPEPG